MSYKMEKLPEISDLGTLLSKRYILIQKIVSNNFFIKHKLLKGNYSVAG